MKIYLAGPLFTEAEREFNRRLKQLLETRGHEVWLPQEKEPRNKTAFNIFLADVEGIDWCDVVVANMDGPDPDSGTCWECGYAYMWRGIVCYRTDFRGCGDAGLSPFNLMMSESADHVVMFPMDTSLVQIADKLNSILDEICSH